MQKIPGFKPSTLHLRPATAADAPLLMELQGHAASGWSIASFEKELTLTWSRTMILERRVPGQHPMPLGAMVYWVVADEVQLLNIAVDSAHRRQGLAGWMLDNLVQRARDGGQARITLEVRRDNLAAQGLYSSRQFRAVGLRPKYYADTGADAILMERDV